MDVITFATWPLEPASSVSDMGASAPTGSHGGVIAHNGVVLQLSSGGRCEFEGILFWRKGVMRDVRDVRDVSSRAQEPQ